VSRVGVWMTHYAAAGSNNERVLPRAIESVLGQTFKDFTLYVFDNHSPGKSPQIIEEYARKDPRTIKVEVPLGIAGIPMARFAWKFLNDKGHDYTITIGGHDYWNSPDHLQILVDRMDVETAARKGNPEVALLYTDTWQCNDADEVMGRFQNITQIGQIARPFIPQVVVSSVDSPQFFGLWNEKVRRNLPIRYECGGFDHLIVMHAALRGMIMWEGRTQLVMRAPPPGDGPDKYGSRHFSVENRNAGPQDFINQIEWCVHCVNEAIADIEPAGRPTFRMMLTASMVQTYMTLRGTNLFQIPGAYEAFTQNPLTIEIMKGAHHSMRMIDALIKSAKPIT
jgi:glycosyltransferase involved in cell wall biosynthesis